MSTRGFIAFFIEQRAEVYSQTLEHLWLTLIALFFALVVAVPLGILMTRQQRISGPLLAVVNTIQTIPSLALLGFMIPLIGIGAVPAIIALFLYAILPILRNTYTGISEVDPSITEAASGMGMTDKQMLFKIELPLALPTLFAGIRTATVINIGVATLAALIGAGGLGEFIFRGIALNNSYMILAGAIPAAAMALFFDWILGMVQKQLQKGSFKILVPAITLSILVILAIFVSRMDNGNRFKAGFPSEFIHREDGYQGLRKTYGLEFDVLEMDIGLMYNAIQSGKVDVVSGFSTDGRIKAFDLVTLDDDKNYFPPYHAAPLVRQEILDKFPEIGNALSGIAGNIQDKDMTQMNYEVDELKHNPRDVARAFLEQRGYSTIRPKTGSADIIIGSKNFTESFILAEMFKIVIESNTNLSVELKLGFGGTKLVFDALQNGDIHLYPEYTGTGLLVLLPEDEARSQIRYDRDIVYEHIYREFKERYNLLWLSPLGFNNTHAMVMRKKDVESLGIKSISDLSDYLKTVE